MTELTEFILAARGTLDPLQLKLAGGAVRRYHNEGDIAAQSVAEHSWRVAIILHHLWPDRPHLVTAALFHDIAEGLVGDIPAPAKRFDHNFHGVMEDIEREYEEFLGIQKQLIPEDHRRLKAADYLELVDYCARQRVPNATRIVVTGAKYILEISKGLPSRDHLEVVKLLQQLRNPWSALAPKEPVLKNLAELVHGKIEQEHPFGFMAEEERRPERRSGFDLGAGRIGYGDRIELLFDEQPTGRLGTVVEVLPDGNAYIKLDDGRPPHQVKGRQLRKAS
jgi:5'-deoxynucleotidase YfbR-like HD superfamily hydrolase